jgi:hypothetical protein
MPRSHLRQAESLATGRELMANVSQIVIITPFLVMLPHSFFVWMIWIDSLLAVYISSPTTTRFEYATIVLSQIRFHNFWCFQYKILCRLSSNFQHSSKHTCPCFCAPSGWELQIFLMTASKMRSSTAMTTLC